MDRLQIRYADSGGSASQHLVLTSPWPESLYAYDRMWSRLSGIARVLAIDLPGFGRSERRTDLLSPTAMSEFLIRILEEWDIADPHLVCPDVGTPAALFAAARHPERIRSLVVGGGATAYPLEVSGALKDLIDAPGIGVFRSVAGASFCAHRPNLEGTRRLRHNGVGRKPALMLRTSVRGAIPATADVSQDRNPFVLVNYSPTICLNPPA